MKETHKTSPTVSNPPNVCLYGESVKTYDLQGLVEVVPNKGPLSRETPNVCRQKGDGGSSRKVDS